MNKVQNTQKDLDNLLFSIDIFKLEEQFEDWLNSKDSDEYYTEMSKIKERRQ